MKIYHVSPDDGVEISVVGISDSPKITTGFGNVAKQIYTGFYEAGFDLSVFGFLDYLPDLYGVLPYYFQESHDDDPMGKGTSRRVGEAYKFVQRMQPDIVFLMIDPGNAFAYATNLLLLSDGLKEKTGRKFEILAYLPIEGFPPSVHQLEAIRIILDHGGDVVVWSRSAAELVYNYSKVIYGEPIDLDYCYFGFDHIPFLQYSPEDKQFLRETFGLQNVFLTGQVGINKRTKGYPTYIYAAKKLQEEGINDVLFYCHTNASHSGSMQGYFLKDMAQLYGVYDYFLWRPDNYGDNDALGVARDLNSLEKLKKEKTTFQTESEWQRAFASLDFVTRMNMLDLYLDVSQVEGWGMPIGEAMACGVPVAMPLDYYVRTEVYGPGAYSYPPLPIDHWDTWHSGARLVGINPETIVDVIKDFKNNPELGRLYAEEGLKLAQTLKWETTRKFLTERVKKLYERMS